MKVIVWQNPDGSLAITVPCLPPNEGETETEWLDRIAAKSVVPGAIKLPYMDHTALPTEYPDCWHYEGVQVKVNQGLLRRQLEREAAEKKRKDSHDKPIDDVEKDAEIEGLRTTVNTLLALLRDQGVIKS